VTDSRERINERLAKASRVWLFLDYDGTLADLAPTPAHVLPHSEVIDLVSNLAHHPRIRLAVVSGRRMQDLEKLLPVPGIFLAGTYGVEIRTPEGETQHREDFDSLRPILQELKRSWHKLLVGRPRFFLEDKGWAIALHARHVPDQEATAVLSQAEALAARTTSSGPFCVLGGDKFLEIAPLQADKGRSVEYLLERYAWPGALPVYLGDDDKDEAAFVVIQRLGGLALVVGSRRQDTDADGSLESPKAARECLAGLPTRMASQDCESVVRSRGSGPWRA